MNPEPPVPCPLSAERGLQSAELSFSTSFPANDDYRYYARIGQHVSPGVLTQVSPTFAGPDVRDVRKGSSVTLTGRSLPSDQLILTFTPTGRTTATRHVTVGPDGSWRTIQTVNETLQVVAHSANGLRSDTHLTLRAR